MTSRFPGEVASRRSIGWFFASLGLLLALLSAQELFDGFRVLLFGETSLAGIDLRMRISEVTRWFNRQSIYRNDASAVYPPASYVVVWILGAGSDFARARTLWAIESGALLIMASAGVVYASRAVGGAQRLSASLLVLSMSAIGPGVANGQLHIVTVLAGVAGVLIGMRREGSWVSDLTGAALIVVALSKPTNGITFFMMLWLLPGRFRPGLLASAGYVSLTGMSLLAQDENGFSLITRWIDRAVSGAEFGAHDGGTANAQTLLAAFGLESWSPIVAVGLLALLGEWLFRRRGADVWILLGCAGLTARVCVYHRTYDDVLAIPALIALMRISFTPQSYPRWIRTVGPVMLACGWCVMGVPERYWSSEAVFETSHLAYWVALLLFLAGTAKHTKGAPNTGIGSPSLSLRP